MMRTFNMGVGLVIIAPGGLQDELAALIGEGTGLRAWELGYVQPGQGVHFTGEGVKR